MTVRHVESCVRMAEAHAKMHLREFVTAEDVNMAIQVMLDSFISAQKFSVARQLKKRFFKYSSAQKEPNELLLYVLHNLLRETIHFERLQREKNIESEPLRQVVIACEDFETRARELQVSEVGGFYKSAEFLSNFQLVGKEIIKTL
jgi:DNA replication licensing factor MCM2